MPHDAGELAARAGQLMVGSAAVLVLLAFLASLPRALRVRRRLRRLAAYAEASRTQIEEEVSRLTRQRAAIAEELGSSRRLRRWLTHPLAVALFQSYRRRHRRSSPAG